MKFEKLFYLDAIQKAWTAKAPDGRQFWYIEGYASDGEIDRDGDRMSPYAIKSMKAAIEGGMNLFLDHKHNVTDTLGVITKCEERANRLWIQARLEDPEINPLVKQLLHKLEIGEKIGFSIGGDMKAHHWEEDLTLGKRVRVIDDVALYEVSAVGLPSNAGAYVIGSVFKSKAVHKMTCNLCADVHKDKDELLESIAKIRKQMPAVPSSMPVSVPSTATTPSGSGALPTHMDEAHDCAAVHPGMPHEAWAAKKDLPFAARPEGAMGYQEGGAIQPQAAQMEPQAPMPGYQEAGEKPPSDWLDRCVEAVAGTADEPYALCTWNWNVQMKGLFPKLNTIEKAIYREMATKMARLSKSRAKA